MKQFHSFHRLLALLLAVTLLFSACTKSPADDGGTASSDPSVSGVPGFINPLPDVDLSAIAKPEPPAADLLKKINDAYNINEETVGWLSVPNTTIDNEVLFHPDDAKTPAAAPFYERKNINKGYDWYGTYWADYECLFGDRNAISKNTIIFGHSMDDNPESVKFSQLKKYLDPTFAAANPYLYFSTPEDNMVWKVFAVSYVDTQLKFNYPNLKNAAFMDLVDELKERSSLNFDADVNANDKILTLSTCTYPSAKKAINDQTRFLIVARLVRPGEAIEATAKVEKNPSPKAPQYK